MASQVEVVNTEPEGKATVESFTVHHNRENLPFRGVIVGRLENGAPPTRKPHPNQSRSSGDETTESCDVWSGERFIANTAEDPAVFQRMMDEECMGASGVVTPGEGEEPNIFTFD